jgi:hypothetical protein
MITVIIMRGEKIAEIGEFSLRRANVSHLSLGLKIFLSGVYRFFGIAFALF